MIDTRCQAHDSSRSGPQGRCQLAAGHEGPHALMFGRNGVRTIRSWLPSNAVPGTVHVREHVAAQESRPWAPGMPAPAWSEHGVPALGVEPAARGAVAMTSGRVAKQTSAA